MYKVPIVLNGMTFKSTEHYYQYTKVTNPTTKEKILNASSPFTAKEIGSSRAHKIDPNWDTLRVSVLYDANYAKFTQHDDLRSLLLSTNDAILIEDSTDKFWGRGRTFSGLNMQGKILMHIRRRLRNPEDIFLGRG